MSFSDQEWHDLIAEEERAFQQLAKAEQQDDRNAENAAAQHWWNVVNSVLWVHLRIHAQEGRTLEYPHFVFARLANIAEELSNGIVPRICSAVQGPGRRKYYLKERHGIAQAIFYHDAAKSGEVDDQSPTKTVSLAFGVSAKAVRAWIRDRDRICVGVRPAAGYYEAETIEEAMKRAAIDYRQGGRGASVRGEP